MPLSNPYGLISAKGTYTGDGNDNKAIAHGLGKVPLFVFITESSIPAGGWIAETRGFSTILGVMAGCTTATATYFYTGVEATLHFNTNTKNYKFYAFG